MPLMHVRPQRHLTVVASVLVMASVALPALAGPRAPIVYANEKAATSAPAPQAAQLIGTDKATQRITFRYPGSSAARVEMASVTSPKPESPAFEAGRTEAPQFAPLTRSFDAASTAARIGAGAGSPVVEAVPLQPLIAAIPAPVESKTVTGSVETGIAIVYEDIFAGLPTANGEIFDQAAMTAAHPSLPLPSMVQVSNPATGKSVMVRVNDRGPFEDGAAFQVSRQVAVALGFEGAGKAQLTFSAVSDAPVASYAPRSVAKADVLLQPAVVKTQAAVITPAVQPVQSDDLLGGDELAGGASWSATPATQPKARVPVKWPEPPADWNVAPAVTKVAASASGTHYVQLASFSDIGNAETLYRGLQRDLPVEIVPARVNGTDYFRVRVGPLANRESAQQIRDRLNAEGKGDGRVVSAE